MCWLAAVGFTSISNGTTGLFRCSRWSPNETEFRDAPGRTFDLLAAVPRIESVGTRFVNGSESRQVDVEVPPADRIPFVSGCVSSTADN